MPKVLVPLAEGCEELEAVTIIDLLRRAEIDVVTAGLAIGPVTASRGTRLLPDTTIGSVVQDTFDMVVLPGGMPGAATLNEDLRIVALLNRALLAGGYAAAICAAPMVLADAGILDGKRATGYPGFIDGDKYPALTYTGSAVECDGKIITSRGPGTAMDFALTIVETLCDSETRNRVEVGLMRG